MLTHALDSSAWASNPLDLNHNWEKHMTTNIEQYVDELGILKAQIANLKEQEAAIKAELILRGVEEAEGELFRLTIRQQISRRLDTALIRKLVPKALLRKAEKEVSSTVVRVTARKGIIPKAA